MVGMQVADKYLIQKVIGNVETSDPGSGTCPWRILDLLKSIRRLSRVDLVSSLTYAVYHERDTCSFRISDRDHPAADETRRCPGTGGRRSVTPTANAGS